MSGPRRAILWFFLSLCCLLLYWPGLHSWFQQDDFAWLNLAHGISTWDEFWKAVLEPKAQGTIRPFSERLYFIVFYGVFGLDALPFRIWAFLNQFLNLILLSEVARRLVLAQAAGSGAAPAGLGPETGRSTARAEVAAAAAPLLWTANAALGIPLSWTSSYNQVLCATFLLGGFLMFLRYTETGERRYYWRQWALFLLGFGALEINVVYPALAGGYALLCARRYVKSTLPLFGASAVYTVIHHLLAPRVAEGPYVLHWDQAVPVTFLHYWMDAFGGGRLASLSEVDFLRALGTATPWVGSAALLGYAAWRLRKGDLLPLFLLGWFAAAIAPVLPLRDHISPYYLTLPTLGLSLLGGVALAAAWKSVTPAAAGRWRWPLRVLAAAVAVLYVATSAQVARREATFRGERGERVRYLVLGVREVALKHPGKIILLSGLRSDLFWSAVIDEPFRLVGVDRIFLTPGSENTIQRHPDLGEISDFVFPAYPTLRALMSRKAVVYDASAEWRLKNISTLYTAAAALRFRDTFSRRVDVGHPYFAEHLGTGWYPAEGGYRWMAKRAEVVLGGPRYPAERLFVKGFAPAVLVKAGPVRLSVVVDGIRVGQLSLDRPDEQFDHGFPLPASLSGREKVRVVLEVDRSYTVPGEGRPLGLVFGALSIR